MTVVTFRLIFSPDAAGVEVVDPVPPPVEEPPALEVGPPPELQAASSMEAERQAASSAAAFLKCLPMVFPPLRSGHSPCLENRMRIRRQERAAPREPPGACPGTDICESGKSSCFSP